MPPNTNPSNAVIIERLERIQKDICQIQETQEKQGEARIQFREEYLVKHTELAAKVSQTITDIAEHTTEIAEGKKAIKTLQDNVGPLIWAGRISAAIASVLGGAFLLLIYQLLTGQATVFFK